MIVTIWTLNWTSQSDREENQEKPDDMNKQREMGRTSGPLKGLRPKVGAEVELRTSRGEADWILVSTGKLYGKSVRASLVRREIDIMDEVDLDVDTTLFCQRAATGAAQSTLETICDARRHNKGGRRHQDAGRLLLRQFGSCWCCATGRDGWRERCSVSVDTARPSTSDRSNSFPIAF